MLRVTVLAVLATIYLCLCPYQSHADADALCLADLGVQITIDGGRVDSTFGAWAKGAGEDNETEGNPNTSTYQRWDLEGMFWNQSTSTFHGQVAQVPEPATLVLLGTGLIGLASLSRRRQRKSM